MTDLYRTVLADLRQKRDTINAAIAAFEVLAEGPSTSTTSNSGTVASVTVTHLKSPARKARTKATKPTTKVRRTATLTPIATVTTAGGAAKPSAPATSSMVEARDQAIVARLRQGRCTPADLRAAMPKEPGLTEEQREAAYKNAMTRLRVKGKIRATADGWELK